MKQKKYNDPCLQTAHNSHSSLFCTFLFFVRTMDTKWTQMEQKIYKAIISQPKHKVHTGDLVFNMKKTIFKEVVRVNFKYCP